MSSQEERRKYKRFIIEGMDVQCKMMFVRQVKLLDISMGGASILVDKHLEIGGNYTLKVESEEGTLPLEATVIWARLSGSEKVGDDIIPMYQAGLSFIDVYTGKGTDLMTFLSDVVPSHASRPRLSGLRVRFKENSSVLGYQSLFEVKKISKGGMLVEVNHELAVDQHFSMELQLPEEEPIRVTGRIASCTLNSECQPPAYNVGIEFMDLDNASRERIDEFIGMLESL